MPEKKVIMVTGGTGLVGQAVRAIAEKEEKRDNEEWVFLSSKDGDLGWVCKIRILLNCNFFLCFRISLFDPVNFNIVAKAKIHFV